MIEYTDTYSGKIVVEESKVTKTFKQSTIAEGLMEREVLWLKRLENFDRTPTIIDIGDDFIVMTYVGERITKQTIPEDWEEQIVYIYETFQKNNCSHNDIKPEEILVKNGKIHIVDFGWSTEIGAPIPQEWPSEIGEQFALGKKNFNDLHSLKKSINYILETNEEN